MLAKLDHHRSRHHERFYAMYTKPRGNKDYPFQVLVRPRSTSLTLSKNLSYQLFIKNSSVNETNSCMVELALPM